MVRVRVLSRHERGGNERASRQSRRRRLLAGESAAHEAGMRRPEPDRRVPRCVQGENCRRARRPRPPVSRTSAVGDRSVRCFRCERVETVPRKRCTARRSVRADRDAIRCSPRRGSRSNAWCSPYGHGTERIPHRTDAKGSDAGPGGSARCRAFRRIEQLAHRSGRGHVFQRPDPGMASRTCDSGWAADPPRCTNAGSPPAALSRRGPSQSLPVGAASGSASSTLRPLLADVSIVGCRLRYRTCDNGRVQLRDRDVTDALSVRGESATTSTRATSPIGLSLRRRARWCR